MYLFKCKYFPCNTWDLLRLQFLSFIWNSVFQVPGHPPFTFWGFSWTPAGYVILMHAGNVWSCWLSKACLAALLCLLLQSRPHWHLTPANVRWVAEADEERSSFWWNLPSVFRIGKSVLKHVQEFPRIIRSVQVEKESQKKQKLPSFCVLK